VLKARDGRPVFARLHADNARGREAIPGHAPRQYPKSDLNDHISLPTE
jgi:hypothetical protein